MGYNIKFWDNWYEAASYLPREKRGEFYCDLFDVIFGGREPDFDGIEAAIWAMMREIVAKDAKLSKSGHETGKKRGEKQQVETVGTVCGTVSRQTVGDTVFTPRETVPLHESEAEAEEEAEAEKEEEVECESESEEEKGPRRTRRFKEPSVEEVSDYIAEKGYHFDAESFIAFYESKGWKVGTSPMKNWKAACTTWEKRWKADHPEPSKVSGIWGTDDTAEGWGNVWTG